MKKHLLSLVLLCAVAATAGAAPTNLISNGGFEDTHGTAVGQVLVLPAGSAVVSPWTVGGDTADAVDVVGTLWTAAEGSNSLDLNGRNIGWIQQSFSTAAGEWYVLTFKMSGNPGRNGGYRYYDKAMSVFATALDGGGSEQDFVFTGDELIPDMKWESRAWTFQAPSDVTVLKFESTSGISNGCGPVLDDICVVSSPVPVPGALLLAGLGTAVVGWMRGRRRS